MRVITVAAALLAAASLAGPAAAEGNYHVRNDTGEPQYCVVRHPGSQSFERIVLRRAGEWRGTHRSDRPRTLVCMNANRYREFRLESGRHYSLTKTGAGTLVLSGIN
jgi:hypothetical protein